MPDILYPVKWVVELLLVAFHNLFTFLGLRSSDGLTWVLAITGLVLVVRAALIPLFVRQIKSQRGMVLLQPELQKLQKKYKGKTDRESREAFAKEQMALYKNTGSNPLSSCLPLLAQMPIFMSLFFVLNEAQHGKAGVGLLSAELSKDFSQATFFGAPLSETFLTASSNTVRILAAVMVVLMTASQFITQRQIISKNQTPANLQNSQYMQTQKIMLWLFPVMFAVSGVSFPLGVMFYWLVSNFWTMGQQYVVIKRMPTPGSVAHDQLQARLAAKGKLTLPEVIEGEVPQELKPEPKGQRNQPTRKKPKKK
ncbi:MAG: membrane protein insertase YidC [Microbacteriaceae bacterium]|nr:membrane protein insertase YidC [Microbacteriaceae bacterium]